MVDETAGYGNRPRDLEASAFRNRSALAEHSNWRPSETGSTPPPQAPTPTQPALRQTAP